MSELLGEGHTSRTAAPVTELPDREALLAYLEAQDQRGTPAAGMLGLLQLCHDLGKEIEVLKLHLDQLRLEPGGTGAWTSVREQVDVLSRTVLDASRPTAPVTVDLAALSSSVVAAAEWMYDGQLELRARPGSLVKGNPVQLRRALVNLLDNARAAAPHGRVRISVQPVEGGATIEVEDDGSGGRQHSSGGSGLGLTIVREVAEQHNGSLTRGISGLGGLSMMLRVQAGGVS
jgi:signal transduction histidine kinase